MMMLWVTFTTRTRSIQLHSRRRHCRWFKQCEGGRIAAETSVTNFLSDFFATPSSWSVKTAGSKGISCTQSLVTWSRPTLSPSSSRLFNHFYRLIIRGNTGHIFHVGDSRLWRLRDEDWECLTKDHALVTRHGNQLTRALGMDWRVDIDYIEIEVQIGDIYLLSTDGIHQFINDKELKAIIGTVAVKPRSALRRVIACAKSHHSDDNRSCQLLEIIDLPAHQLHDLQLQHLAPLPPELHIG
jgi:hypothetical protein